MKIPLTRKSLGNGRLTDNKINPSYQQVREGGRLDLNLLSADDRAPLKPLKKSQQYNYIIYHLIKIQLKMVLFLSLWERFQSGRRLKLLKEG